MATWADPPGLRRRRSTGGAGGSVPADYELSLPIIALKQA
jgi:hypothetical protein